MTRTLLVTAAAWLLLALGMLHAQEGDKMKDPLARVKEMNRQAVQLQSQGRCAEAKRIAEQAVALAEKDLGPDHPDTATSLNKLALLLKTMGDLKGARPLYERALAADEKTLGPEHPGTATALGNLGLLLLKTGDLAGARPLLERALAIRETALGPEHLDTAQSLNNLASLLEAMGDARAAAPLRVRAWGVNRRALQALLPTLCARERGALLAARAPQLAGCLGGSAKDPEASYSAALTWKGAALRATFAAQHVPQDAPQGAGRAAEDLASARHELARLAFAPPAPKPGEPSAEEKSQSMRRRVEGLERKLAEQLPDFAARAGLDVELPDVRKALPEGAVLLDLLENCGMLHAWVVPREGDVEYFDLGTESDLLPLVAAFRMALEKDEQKQWKEAGSALLERLARPIDALKGAKTLYISPDGPLATIPWGLLPDGEGFLIERFPIVCVTGGGAGLVLSTRTSLAPAADGLLCVGDVDYEHAEGAEGITARPQRQVPARPSSKDEAEAVMRRFAASRPKAPANLLTGAAATVLAFEKLAPSARFVHVATRGLFDAETPRLSPLLRSAIVLAGANAGDGGSGSSGLLTAEELQGLDLSGTELVVLSGEETGRGELAAGEGVLGLSSALFVAGARASMLSLWAPPTRRRTR